MAKRWHLPAALVFLLAPASANEVVETSTQWYAAYELQRGGEAFYDHFLGLGWPTDAEHQRLTHAYADEPAADVISALLSSGAGLPLSASHELKGDGSSPVRVATVLAKYRSQARLDAALPATFDPTCIPALRGRQQLLRAYRDDDISTWRWVEAPEQYSLEGLGFALLGEASFAREQLRRANPRPRDAFFAYVALHSALAKAKELRHLIYDSRRQRIAELEEPLLELEEHRYHFANAWTSATDSKGLLEHTIAAGDVHRRSYLRAQSAVLLGLTELLALTDPDTLKGSQKPQTLSAKHHEEVLELTLAAFKMLRAHHIDVREGKARSNSKSSVASPIDLGLCLMALEAFLEHAATKDRSPLKALCEDERGKARTLVSRLGQQLRELCDAGGGLFDSYDLSGRRIDRSMSVAAQAFAARGLLSAHRVLNPGSHSGPLLDAAHKTLIWLDDERWTPKGRLYVDEKLGKEVQLFGVASLLGTLREFALYFRDGHYLLRYRQLLEGAHEAGLFQGPNDRNPASLAPTLTLP